MIYATLFAELLFTYIYVDIADNSNETYIRKHWYQHGIYGCLEGIQDSFNHALLHKLRKKNDYEKLN